MNFILAYLGPRPEAQGDAGILALILLVSLLVALGAYAVGRHIWHCPYRPLLIAGPTFLGAVYLFFRIFEFFAGAA